MLFQISCLLKLSGIFLWSCTGKHSSVLSVIRKPMQSGMGVLGKDPTSYYRKFGLGMWNLQRKQTQPVLLFSDLSLNFDCCIKEHEQAWKAFPARLTSHYLFYFSLREEVLYCYCSRARRLLNSQSLWLQRVLSTFLSCTQWNLLIVLCLLKLISVSLLDNGTWRMFVWV